MDNSQSTEKKEKKNLKEVFDSIASEFSKRRQNPWKEVERFIKDTEGNTAIDLGCGNGRHLTLLREKFEKIIGLDLSKEMLHEAIDYADDLRGQLVQGDMTALPLKSSIADSALCIASLHHIPSKKGRMDVLKEINRVLNKQGRCLIGVWAIEHPKFDGIRDKIKRKKGDIYVPWESSEKKDSYNRFYHIYQKSEFESLLESSPLKKKKVELSSGNYYAIASSEN